MHKNKRSKGKVVLSILLSVIMVCSIVTVGTVSMSAETSTGIGLCAYALNAYNEGWPYVWGGASYGAVDCSGLIQSYNGVGGVRTDMVTSSQSAGLDWGYVSNGVPNIHGLGLHKPGHVGIYVGSGNAIDARGTNWGIIYGSLNAVSWVEWYKIVGVSYPESGWVKFDGESFYYENGEYIDSTSRTIDGVTYYFDSLGRADKEPPESAYEVTDYSGNSGSANITNNSSTFLKIGSQGDRVKEVQQRLKELGYFEDEVTGYYGTYTSACVKEFQTDANIEVDGIVGPEFMNAIESDNAPSKNGANTLATEVPTEEPTEEVTEEPTEEVTEEVTEEPTEEVTEEITEKPAEEVTEEVTEEPAEEITEEVTEEPTEKVTEEVTEEPTEKVTEEIIEQATEVATEEPTEEITEQATEEVMEEITEVATEEPTLPPETPLEDGVIIYYEYDVDGNSDIADMQSRLAQLGYYKSDVTGVFDEDTLNALHEYFESSDIRVEDFITQEQYDFLMSDKAVAKTADSDYTKEKVVNVQRVLKKLGYLESGATETGVYDTETANAVKTAQANLDTEVTGELSETFVKSLELEEARVDSQANTTTGNVSTENATTSSGAVTVSSGNTTVSETSSKKAPLTGYTFGDAKAPVSNDDITLIWVVSMIVALALGTTAVYAKSKLSKKK